MEINSVFNFLINFSFWSFLRPFLIFYFIAFLIFDLILWRQINLMGRLFKTNLGFLLSVFSWLLFGLGFLGLLMAIF